MHELGIAAEIWEQASGVMRENGAARCKKIAVRVGELAGVDVESLRFGLEALAKEGPFEATAIEIEWIERRQRCPRCEEDFAAPGYKTECPKCGELATTNVAGDELQIAYLEVDE